MALLALDECTNIDRVRGKNRGFKVRNGVASVHGTPMHHLRARGADCQRKRLLLNRWEQPVPEFGLRNTSERMHCFRELIVSLLGHWIETMRENRLVPLLEA